MVFLQADIHLDTVIKALRILVHLLCDRTLFQKFHDGEIFGAWVHGFESISVEMSGLLTTSTSFNPLRGTQTQMPLPGAAVLAQYLPHHLQSPQVFLLMIAILLGRPATEIPFSAKFDMETMDTIFQISNSAHLSKIKLCADAAFVLLAMVRVLLQVGGTYMCM